MAKRRKYTPIWETEKWTPTPEFRTKTFKELGEPISPTKSLAPTPEITPEPTVLEKGVRRPVKGQKFTIGGEEVSAEEFEKITRRQRDIHKLLEEGGRKALTPAEKEAIMTPEEIRERERLEREGITTEELPPEELPPVTAEAKVETPLDFLLRELEEGYATLDTVGGLIPPLIDPETGEPIIQSTVPFSPAGGLGYVKAGKDILNTAKVAQGVRATKVWAGMLKYLKTNWGKIFKWGGLGYVLWGERTIQNIDSALSQTRETLTLPVSLAASDPTQLPLAWDMVEDYEDDILEDERMLKSRENAVPLVKFSGRFRPIYRRIKKLKAAIEVTRTQLSVIEAENRVLTDEETTLLLNNIDVILKEMEDPIKFLGVF